MTHSPTVREEGIRPGIWEGRGPGFACAVLISPPTLRAYVCHSPLPLDVGLRLFPSSSPLACFSLSLCTCLTTGRLSRRSSLSLHLSVSPALPQPVPASCPSPSPAPWSPLFPPLLSLTRRLRRRPPLTDFPSPLPILPVCLHLPMLPSCPHPPPCCPQTTSPCG